MKSRNRTRAHRERGTALIEFALVLPFMLVLTMLVIDFSRAFYVKNMLHQAAREAVRVLVVTSDAEIDLVTARARAVALNGGITDVAVEVTPAASPNGLAQVQCTAEFQWLYPGLLNFIGVEFTNPTTLNAAQVMKDE
jgi:Flp pilus assembly protein TadG